MANQPRKYARVTEKRELETRRGILATQETLDKAKKSVNEYSSERLLIMAFTMLNQIQMMGKIEWLNDNLTLEVIRQKVLEINSKKGR